MRAECHLKEEYIIMSMHQNLKVVVLQIYGSVAKTCRKPSMQLRFSMIPSTLVCTHKSDISVLNLC